MLKHFSHTSAYTHNICICISIWFIRLLLNVNIYFQHLYWDDTFNAESGWMATTKIIHSIFERPNQFASLLRIIFKSIGYVFCGMDARVLWSSSRVTRKKKKKKKWAHSKIHTTTIWVELVWKNECNL